MACVGESSDTSEKSYKMVSREINLLSSLPKSSRNVARRSVAKNQEIIAEAKRFGKSYFDGTREQGYGGYVYDRRWLPVAKDIIEFFKLEPGAKVLDIGCAKGFLLQDLASHGMNICGLDISSYALNCAHHKIRHRLDIGTADALPYRDKFFDLVLSINTLHNLPKDRVVRALQEIERVSRGKSYIVIDSYHTPEEKEIFESWALTPEFHGYPDEWIEVFEEAGYRGHYSWNLL